MFLKSSDELNVPDMLTKISQIMPIPQISTLSSYHSSDMISGAAYKGELIWVMNFAVNRKDGCSSFPKELVNFFAIPKSISFTLFSFETMTLCGFMSLCQIPHL